MSGRSRTTPRDSHSPVRLRRLRARAALRDWVAETDLAPRHLIYPVFVGTERSGTHPLPSLPGLSRHSADAAGRLSVELLNEGVRSVLLFGAARRKTGDGREAWSPDGAVQAAVRAIKARAPDLVVVTDVCLCAYTTQGHCGVVRNGRVDNDRSVEALTRIAMSHAASGADIVAPSAMMDHQVAGIRAGLDRADQEGTGILAYATKHASTFYGPFREAEGSTPSFGDRATYQLDPRNAREAMREFETDAAEGADMLMVKPAMTSLDLLARARGVLTLPLAAYQVSGEYAMIKAAARAGVFDEAAAVRETLVAIRRAGADLIVTYFARDFARSLQGGR